MKRDVLVVESSDFKSILVFDSLRRSSEVSASSFSNSPCVRERALHSKTAVWNCGCNSFNYLEFIYFMTIIY